MNQKQTKLFGTDGIRGTSNQFPMVPDVVVKLDILGLLLAQKVCGLFAVGGTDEPDKVTVTSNLVALSLQGACV